MAAQTLAVGLNLLWTGTASATTRCGGTDDPVAGQTILTPTVVRGLRERGLVPLTQVVTPPGEPGRAPAECPLCSDWPRHVEVRQDKVSGVTRQPRDRCGSVWCSNAGNLTGAVTGSVGVDGEEVR